MLPDDWTPHRRDDGELLGWIRPEGEGWVAVDVLGRTASDPVDWLDAEAALEEIGLGWLADVWMLEGEAPGPLRVRFVEVTPSDGLAAGRVVVKVDDFGDIHARRPSGSRCPGRRRLVCVPGARGIPTLAPSDRSHSLTGGVLTG